MNTYIFIFDKERTLQYTNRSFRELEKRSGFAVLTKVQELSTGKAFSLQYITDFIWAGLLYEKIPYETVIDIIPLNKYLELTKFIVDIVTEEFGLPTLDSVSDEKKSENHQTNQQDGTGIAQSLSPIQT